MLALHVQGIFIQLMQWFSTGVSRASVRGSAAGQWK